MIDSDNKYSEDFKNLLATVKKYHELEIEKLTVSYAIGVQKAKENEFNKKYIEENEEKYRRIEAQQKELTKDGSINLRDEYKKIVIQYYFEEKAINQFKLFYFF